MDLNEEQKAALDAFCARVRAAFGARVVSITLFGSRARGDAHADSDIDVCVVIDGLDWREKHEVYGIAGDVIDDHDVVLSPYVVSRAHMAHLHARERAIAAEIARDSTRRGGWSLTPTASRRRCSSCSDVRAGSRRQGPSRYVAPSL
ncbi:MAG: nucleotidyltransferase domain-containing protein [Labilithrix sp.]|nr:nucleotidyltransferase domain-containing protein [Labilithrix sp.]MCW5810068.1 nucleotidyltransferase domain-containing protein [Labilithrix sp.]